MRSMMAASSCCSCGCFGDFLMPRQPFLPKYEGRSYAIGAKVIEQRPEFVRAIGGCLTLWPFVEHQMAMVLGILLKADNEAAIAVYNVLRTGRTQRDALNAAASTTLSTEMWRAFQAMLSVLETTERECAALAHGHWGVLDDFQDRVLWVESKHHSPWNALVLLGKGQKGHEGLLPHLYVWTLQDVTEIYEHIEELWKISFDYVLLLRRSYATGIFGPRGDELLRHLCELPRMAEALANLDRRAARQARTPLRSEEPPPST